jgi:hypothetical protein
VHEPLGARRAGADLGERNTVEVLGDLGNRGDRAGAAGEGGSTILDG